MTTSEYVELEYAGEIYRIKPRYKRLKMMKLLITDPVGAFELAFVEEDFEKLLNLDYSEEEFQALLDALSSALAGGKGNS